MKCIYLPTDVKLILERLSSFSSYVVGGCVRDSLLGITPKDWDICTSINNSIILDLSNVQSFFIVYCKNLETVLLPTLAYSANERLVRFCPKLKTVDIRESVVTEQMLKGLLNLMSEALN